MKYKSRSIEKTLNSLIDKTPVIMINGPRQVGKSTLLEHLLVSQKGKINRVSFDNIILRNKAKEDPELFLNSYDTPLIIDEFQYVPELLIYIKIKVDEARTNNMFYGAKEVGTMYYLTGSEPFKTNDYVSESLAGRVSILDLYGFSRREIEEKKEEIFIPDINLLKKKEPLKKCSIQDLYSKILNGSYPELNLDLHKDREQFYEDYIRTYIERDVRKIINIKDENKFIKFISSLAARTSQEYVASEIADDIEVDAKTVDEWLSVLKNTNLVYMLQSYSNNNLSNVIKRPKIYFMDTGLACYLSGYMSADTLEKSAYNGAIFETYVVSEVIKSLANNGKNAKRYLYYYRDKEKKEIDLLIIYDNVVYPVEIKKSSNPNDSMIKNFDVVKKFNMEIGTGIVLCMVSEIIPINANNYYVPIWYI